MGFPRSRTAWTLVAIGPGALGWAAIQGQRSGLFSPEAGIGLLVVAMMAGFAAILLRSQRSGPVHGAGGVSSSDTFRGLLESAPDAMVIVDRQGRIILVNAQVERLFGYRREELLGQEVETLVPGRFQGHAGQRDAYLEGPRTRPMGAGLDLFGKRQDGTEFPVEISLSPLQTAEGLLVSAAIRDISGRRETERVLEQHRRELESTNRELEAFAYSVSHDLRAPLRSIDSFSRILLEDFDARLGPDGRDALHRIRAATRRMGCLIDDLLALSRVTRAELRRCPVDLSELARDIASTLEASGAPGVEWVIADGARAEGDPRLLRLVLENLIGNACKFSARAPHPRVEFGWHSDAGCPVYFVRDNGAGFDMGHVAKLFGAFQRLHSEHEFPGTGVGLATAQRIIHRHGGRIWAEGAVGQGATFSFTLVLNEPSSAAGT